MIDPQKIQLVGRLGGNFYSKAFGDAVFEVEKPLKKMGIGVDGLPQHIRKSDILTGNDLGKFGNTESLPSNDELSHFKDLQWVKEWFTTGEISEKDLHKKAAQMIREGDVSDALRLLMIS